MPSGRSWVIVLVIALSCVCRQQAAGQDEIRQPDDKAPTIITVRTFRGMRPEGYKALADMVQPQTVKVGEPKTLAEIVKRQCGDGLPPAATALLVEKAEELNAGQQRDTVVPAGLDVKVPFCPPIEKDKRVVVAPGENFESILARDYGLKGRKTYTEVWQSSQRPENACVGTPSPSDCSGKLNGGEVLVLPYASTWVSGRLEHGVTASSLLAELEKSTELEVRPAITSNFVATSIEAISANEPPIGSPPTVPAKNCTATSPFNSQQLLERLHDVVLTIHGKWPERPAHIAVADTGFSRRVTQEYPWLDKGFFYVNESGKSDGEDNDQNGIDDDIYGVGFDGLDLPLSGDFFGFENKAYDDRSAQAHGTRVASLTLGGPDFIRLIHDATPSSTPPTFGLINSPVRISHLRLVWPEAAMVRYSPSARSILFKDMQGRLMNPATDILNVSWGHEDKNAGIHETTDVMWSYFKTGSSILVVAAAGYEKGAENLHNVKNRYPAVHGGLNSTRGAFVTVAAHDADGRPLASSSFDPINVDLAAQGCGFSLFGFDGSIERAPQAVEGSSLAAGLVSFAAGLLKYVGISGPLQIKERLTLSTTRTASLAEKSWTDGKLDIMSAISIDGDVVRCEDCGAGPLTSWAICEPDIKKLLDLCSESSLRENLSDKRLAKVSVFEGEGGRMVRYLSYKRNAARDVFGIEKVQCTWRKSNSILTLQRAGRRKTVSAEGIEDVTLSPPEGHGPFTPDRSCLPEQAMAPE